MLSLLHLGFLLKPVCLAPTALRCLCRFSDLTAGHSHTLASQLGGIFNPLFLFEIRGCMHTHVHACRRVERGVCGSLLSLTGLYNGPSAHLELPAATLQVFSLGSSPGHLSFPDCSGTNWQTSMSLGRMWGDTVPPTWTWSVQINTDQDA